PWHQSGLTPWPKRPCRVYAAALFGRLPRRAAARPGIFPAQSSQRSPTFQPRPPSVYVTRSGAPLFSPICFSQLSQTRTVLRAKEFLLRGVREFQLRQNSGGDARSPNSPRSEQTQRRRFLRIELDVVCAHDAQMSFPEIVDRSPVEILLDDSGAH